MSQNFFNKENAQEKLKKGVDSAVYARGFSYYQDGLVGRIRTKFVQPGNVKISAFILGSDEYETNALFDLKKASFKKFSCSCPYEWGDCKHSVALGLKFLDLYAEFCAEFENADDEEGYEDELVNWIMGSESNKAQGWEDEYYDYGDNEEAGRGFSPKKSKIILPKNDSSGDRNADLKNRLKSVGIDAENIPASILGELEKRVGTGDLQIGLQKSAKSGADFEIENLGDHFLKKHCLILKSEGYFPSIELHEKNKPDQTYWAVRPNDYLGREKNRLTQKQKELLVSLGRIDSWYDSRDVDWGQLLTLAKDCEMEIFLNRKNVKNRLNFSENPQKIKAKLFFSQNEYRREIKNDGQEDVIFSFENPVFENKKTKFFLGQNSLVILAGLRLEIFSLPSVLAGIFQRIMRSIENYHYVDQYGRRDRVSKIAKTSLEEDEIIQINEVIEAARNVFDFENMLPEKFEIEKFAKIGPVILVDYDSANSLLQLQATMDYGFSKIDIANTVYKSMRGGRSSFQWRHFQGREKYHLEIKAGKINYAEIAEKEEIALFRKLSENEKFGFSKTVSCLRKSIKKIEQFYVENWSNVKALGYRMEYVRDEFDFVEDDFKVNFEVDFDKANDWFEFDVACYCGENSLNIEDLRKYVKNKQRFLRLADGRILKITNRQELEKFVLMLESFYQKENQKFEGKIFHAPELEDVMAGSQYYTGKISQSFKNFMAEAQSGKPVEKIVIPAKIKKPLRDYQKDGIDWFYFLRKYHFGGILADDMGLGKTLQALSLIEMNKIENKPSIVICPKTLLFNWEDEAEKFFPKMSKLIISGSPAERQRQLEGAEKYDLVITSYPSVKKDQQYYDKIKFNYCFIDEAQYIKNHKTQNAKSVKKINADYRLALTGTPLENSVSEIWSLFDFLMPGFLGTQHSFAEKLERPIMKNADSGALAALKKKTSCFILRRTKEKVLKELPPKIQQVAHCQLGSEQNILYQEILKNVKQNINDVVEEKGFAKSQIHILAGLTKLRQVCNHPVLLLKDKNHEKYSSAKMELFLELVGEIVSAGKKVLVFSQFTQMLDILAKELDKQEISYHYLSGKTNNRKELVDDFNSNEKIPVFLISLKAGGTGLNLVSADNVIIFDPWWNPSVENQAIDRAHRIGQKKSVNVYRLIVKGTIEEKIMQLQAKKQSLFDNMIGESDDLFQKLTWSDVKELFQ